MSAIAISMTARHSQSQLQDLTQAVLQDGFCILHIAREGDLQNRGAARYYVTLPFHPLPSAL
ncbi:MAG: hypothetical protein KME12_17865 [Trichocoleus desertorum ATA4-8-CV12]|nr:hypothetical protein [Trichocoleus desertorum ATA4-8-CV12]